MSSETPKDSAAAPAAASAAPAAAAPAAAASDTAAAPAGPTKSELKKRAKEAEKAKKAAERAAREEEERKKREAAAAVDNAAQNYGKLPLNQSQERPNRTWVQFSKLSDADVGKEVVFRARLHNKRPQGAKIAFFQFRQQIETLQGVLVISKEDDPNQVSKQMLKYALAIPTESIVVVEGVIKAPKDAVKSCTIQKYEVQVNKLHVAVESEPLPFSIEDASRSEADFKKAEEDPNLQYVRVNLDTRLDNRIIDLRTPANQAIFRLQSAVGNLFREYLDGQGFVEIHSPKLQGAATESGSSVFKVQYFNGQAFLAQSPQLAKQMCIASDFERVYEIGPVFRAENSNTYRHLTEFMGLDLEMSINEHYHEVRDTLDETLKFVFKGLQQRYGKEIAAVRAQHGGEELVILDKTPIVSFKDGIQMLKAAGAKQEDGTPIGDMDDLSTENEKWLGRLVKEKLGCDYYILDKFPSNFRPFYTMPDPTDPTLSNSYDFMLNGQEIMSGGQRVHDKNLLVERIKAIGMDPKALGGYVEAFAHGVPPHGGGGVGLERVVMLFLGLGNIR